MWAGDTVAILAGGPSLTQADADYCRGKCRVLAINNSYMLAPWADMLWFCDRRWYEWHKESLAEFNGLICTLENYDLEDERIKHVHNFGRDGFHPDPDGVKTGRNSGYQAMHLAIHLGVRRMLLLGYDMRFVSGRSHWHGGHSVPVSERMYAQSMVPLFATLKPALTERGIDVINCTPGSALKEFRYARIDTCL